MNEELLTCKELAVRLRVRPSSVGAWARARRIPAIRIGRKVVRFDYEEVRRALQGQRDSDSKPKVGDNHG